MSPKLAARRSHCLAILAAALTFAVTGCGPETAATSTAGTATVPASGEGPVVRNRILPRVDHHQHLLGPGAVSKPAAKLPDITLPPELERVLAARNRIMDTNEPGELFTDDAQVMNAYEGRWIRGKEVVTELAGDYSKDTRYFANHYVLGDSVAVIAGIVRSGSPQIDELNFQLGLVKDGAGAWRIATEHTSLLPELAFTKPVTAGQVIDAMDDAGIEQAVVLSLGFWFGDPTDTYPGDEYENVRTENDWTAAEVAKYPNRLVLVCGVSPIREYAVAEVRRCGRDLGARGIKLHLSNSKVNLHDAKHIAMVKEVFRAANELGLALVVHTRTHRSFGGYGRAEAEIFMRELLTAAPDVPVQIAHLWGGADFSDEALGTFADAVSRNDPRMRHVIFDLTDAERNAGGAEGLATIARRIRQIGVERVVYGSDMLTPDAPPPVVAWARMRRKLALTDQEFAAIADNVAPYIRGPVPRPNP